METEKINETNRTTAAELRADAYANCLEVEFPEGSGELITFDEAAKYFNSYNAVGDERTAGYLREQMIAAKHKIKEQFPDED